MPRAGNYGGPDAGTEGRHADGDPDELLVELARDGQRRYLEGRQLSPERGLAPRSHTPQRPRKLPRIVAQARLYGL